MFFSGVDVVMAQNFGNDVDIAGFPIEVGAECAAKFVRSDVFKGGNYTAVFFDQILNGPR